MKKYLYPLIIISFLTITFVIINITNKTQSKLYKIERDFFKNTDLELKGIICNIEKQTDTYKFLITLNNIKSNYPNYSTFGSTDTNFCVIINDLAVFADHFNNYKIGDTIYIGENSTDIIKCVSTNGKIKLIKKREKGMLYEIDKPNKRMIELINIGCK